MGTQLRWIRPTTHNVKALWARIKDGQFKTAGGLPRFQAVKDIEDPDILYITWTYDKTALVRCSIDDFPAYLPDEDQARARKVLSRVAGRGLRAPRMDLTDLDRAIDPVQRFAEEAEDIFTGNLALLGLGEELEMDVTKMFRDTLQEMVRRKMLKGT